MIFHIKSFDPSFVKETKVKVSNRNRESNFNNLPSDKGNRWVGELGELAFLDFLERLDLKEGEDFHYTARDTDKAPYDFNIDWLNLDVKIVATKYFPRLHYGCDIDPDQFLKPECNGFVFGRYILDENKVVLMGWITKEQVKELGVQRRKGDILNKLVVEKDFIEVPIKDLTPLSSLLFYTKYGTKQSKSNQE